MRDDAERRLKTVVGAAVPVRRDRWEHGSDFHLSSDEGACEAPWLAQRHTLWGSGRDALRALLTWGRLRYGWRRLFVPAYFCEDVVGALERELPIVRYADAPDDPPPMEIDTTSDDVVLVINYFGAERARAVKTRGILVEDLTHDPLAIPSIRTDYAVASLRKTLPLPDGGVMWSPAGRPLPAERLPTELHSRCVLERLLAMLLKRDYLAGADVDKSWFRTLFVESERTIGSGPVSGISAFSRERLRSLPAAPWRDMRVRNLAAFATAFGETPGVQLLDVPFAATLLFESGRLRDQVRSHLIAEHIYPAILWPPSAEHRETPDSSSLSHRLLTIHSDFRYDIADMGWVAHRTASLVRAAAQACA
jgi:hypothetical protein